MGDPWLTAVINECLNYQTEKYVPPERELFKNQIIFSLRKRLQSPKFHFRFVVNSKNHLSLLKSYLD